MSITELGPVDNRAAEASVSPGDSVLFFAGGRRSQFVATGRIKDDDAQDAATITSGPGFAEIGNIKILDPPVYFQQVAEQCGFARPWTREAVITASRQATQLDRLVRGLPPSAGRSGPALEGMLTESRSRHRSAKLRRQAFELAQGRCAACGGDFRTVAGGVGLNCLVVHHTKQIGAYDAPKETSLSDLAVVCANCHMMIHSNPKRALSIGELKSLLGA